MKINKPGGKGDGPRPMDIDRKKFEENFDRIFGKPEKPEVPEVPQKPESPESPK